MLQWITQTDDFTKPLRNELQTLLASEKDLVFITEHTLCYYYNGNANFLSLVACCCAARSATVQSSK